MSRLYYEPDTISAMEADGGGPSADDRLKEAADKIASLIPAEVVAAYSLLVSFASLATGALAQHICFAVAFLLGLVTTPLYLNKMADPGRPKVRHLIISTAAFPFWAYLTSGAVVLPPDFYSPAIAGFAVAAFTLATGWIPLTR